MNTYLKLIKYVEKAFESYIIFVDDVKARKEMNVKFQEACIKMSVESSKALNELSIAIKKMSQPLKAKPHVQNAKQAAQNLKLLLTANIWKNLNLSEVTSDITVGTLLVDMVGCTKDIVDAVNELATLAKFKDVKDNKVASGIETPNLSNQGSIKRRSFANHVITIESSSLLGLQKSLFLNSHPLYLCLRTLLSKFSCLVF